MNRLQRDRAAAVRWHDGSGRQVVIGAALVLALLAAVAAPVRAQSAQTDPHWQAWLGCWEPMSGPARAPGDTAAVPLVCVVPAAGSPGVDVVTVSDGQVVTREPVDASGQRRPVSRDGCNGWEQAVFSGDAARVFLTAEYTCPGNLQRTTSELMAITPQGEWLDVRGAAVRGVPSGVRVLRYQAASKTAKVPSDLAWATEWQGMAVSTAREAASQPITVQDVVEATHRVDPAVVEAWLTEEDQPFDLTGQGLLALKHEGVPGRVLDVMVAVSYPDVFALNVNTHEAERRAPRPSAAETYYGSAAPGYGWGYASAFGCYTPFAWNCYSPYGWGYYSPYINAGYGYYSPYGYWGGYGYYPPGGVVVVSGGGGQVARHGRMVIGSGYTQNGGGSAGAALRQQGSGRTAVPRQRGSGRVASPPPSSPSPPPRAAPSSGSSERAPAARPGGETGRRAVPKPGR